MLQSSTPTLSYPQVPYSENYSSEQILVNKSTFIQVYSTEAKRIILSQERNA